MVFLQLLRWIATIPALHGFWQGFWRDRRAVTSVEYVIIALIIAVAIMGGLSRIGGYLGTDFNNVSSEL
jgi:Flp pilus assembly pilin Flp